LSSFNLDPQGNWKSQLAGLPARDRGRVQWTLFAAWDEQLDRGAGACELAKPELSKIVEDSLLHFDGDRYVLTDAVVMPNHVHLLAAFRDEDTLLAQCTSWKRYTGRAIQAVFGRHGEFWQVEQFDHLVRSDEQFEHYRRYIATNPEKARLAPGTYRWYSKRT
jgi:type I restriction enzyme R subunit